MTRDLQQIQTVHALLVIATAALAALSGLVSPWGVFFGGAVMGLNFWLMRKFFGYLLSPDAGRRAATVVALGVAKQVAFFGLVGLLFWRIDLDAVAFAIGVTILLIACVSVTLTRQPVTA
jgi:hypothetical protein